VSFSKEKVLSVRSRQHHKYDSTKFYSQRFSLHYEIGLFFCSLPCIIVF